MESNNNAQNQKFSTWQEAVGQLNTNFGEMLKMYSQMLQSLKALGEGANVSFEDVYRRIKELENSKTNQSRELQAHIVDLQSNIKNLGEKLLSTNQIFESYNKMFSYVENELKNSRKELEAIKDVLRKNNLI